jgi:1-acyl-sn-glycerol-3-phosphate acyltransferase
MTLTANPGVRSLARHQNRLPQPGSIIASSFTSPIDCLYLAAIFDPIFTASYPSTRLVQRISLFQAIIRALARPQVSPPAHARLVPLSTLVREHPDSAIVVLPEGTTTNGRGILHFCPSLLSAPATAKIFSVNLRYTPADITTPIPGSYLTFLWDLCHKPTHCIRVRIAEVVYNTAASPAMREKGRTRAVDELELRESPSSEDTLVGESDVESLSVEERKVLDRVADDLARLGRVKRVGLGVKEKVDFVKAWTRTRRPI